MRGLALTIEQLEGNAVRIALRGELDMEHAYTFDEELRRIEALEPKCICIDLRELRIALLQLGEILLGVIQPIGMIDAQALHLAFSAKLQDEAMGRFEHAWVLHAQCREIASLDRRPAVLTGG